MSAPSVAVVVPTLDRPHGLQRCLGTVLRGTLRPEQIIVCDQSASEETRLLVQAMDQQGIEIGYVNFSPPNASVARNAGLEEAGTDLVAFIDDDCVAAPSWLEALARSYVSTEERERVSAVTGRVMPMQSVAGKGVATSSRISAEMRYFRAGEGGLERGEWAPWDAGTGGNMLAPRATLQALHGFDAHLGPGTPARAAEDIDLLYRLLKVGTIVYEPGAIVYHPTTTRRKRLSSRFYYGFGMGTMLTRHIAMGDLTARRLLRLYLRHQAAQALRRGPWGPVESMLVLAGASTAILKQRIGGTGQEPLIHGE